MPVGLENFRAINLSRIPFLKLRPRLISHQCASTERRQKFEQMFSILNRALSWAITSFGNKFCLKKRTRLTKALDNRFYVKFMQLEKGLLRSA